MRIIFGENVEVVDDRDLTRLEVCSRLSGEELYLTFVSMAWLEPEGTEHVRICPKSLLQLCPSNLDAEWRRQFDRMIELAKAHGYVNSKGWIRAHVSEN